MAKKSLGTEEVIKKKPGRKRIIPVESKVLKYFYIIKVKFKGRDIVKFGISNNFVRRSKEYNNSETVGYFIDLFHLYKCNNPKQVETLVKWRMRSLKIKPVFKQEYFEMKYLDYIIEQAKYFANEFNIKFKEIQISDIKIWYLE